MLSMGVRAVEHNNIQMKELKVIISIMKFSTRVLPIPQKRYFPYNCPRRDFA